MQCFAMALVQPTFTGCSINYAKLLQQHAQLLNRLGRRPIHHDVTDRRKYMILGIFCKEHIMIELHFLIF